MRKTKGKMERKKGDHNGRPGGKRCHRMSPLLEGVDTVSMPSTVISRTFKKQKQLMQAL